MGWKETGDERGRRYEVYKKLEREYAEARARAEDAEERVRLLDELVRGQTAQLLAAREAIRALATQLAQLAIPALESVSDGIAGPETTVPVRVTGSPGEMRVEGSGTSVGSRPDEVRTTHGGSRPPPRVSSSVRRPSMEELMAAAAKKAR